MVCDRITNSSHYDVDEYDIYYNSSSITITITIIGEY